MKSNEDATAVLGETNGVGIGVSIPNVPVSSNGHPNLSGSIGTQSNAQSVQSTLQPSNGRLPVQHASPHRDGIQGSRRRTFSAPQNPSQPIPKQKPLQNSQFHQGQPPQQVFMGRPPRERSSSGGSLPLGMQDIPAYGQVHPGMMNQQQDTTMAHINGFIGSADMVNGSIPMQADFANMQQQLPQHGSTMQSVPLLADQMAQLSIERTMAASQQHMIHHGSMVQQFPEQPMHHQQQQPSDVVGRTMSQGTNHVQRGMGMRRSASGSMLMPSLSQHHVTSAPTWSNGIDSRHQGEAMHAIPMLSEQNTPHAGQPSVMLTTGSVQVRHSESSMTQAPASVIPTTGGASSDADEQNKHALPKPPSDTVQTSRGFPRQRSQHIANAPQWMMQSAFEVNLTGADEWNL
eukprot:m.1197369 g.1197369  ORF g.1197369 m.1197369 type:complete len:403 (-) comp24567_c0_seq1:3131-4339(-)